MKNIIAFIVLAVSLAGLYFAANPRPLLERQAQASSSDKLKRAVSASIGSMTSVDKPLGDTEEVKRASEKILMVTEFLHREYTLGNGMKFTLYISYWEPGREDVYKASTHTPDRCWVKSGWKNLDEKKRSGDVLSVGGRQLMPAYYREYTINAGLNNYKRNVWFWFIVDGKRYDYKTSDNYNPSIAVYLKNLISSVTAEAPEMFFIRIDSDSSLESLRRDPDFQKLLSELGELILFQKVGEASNG